MGCAWVVGDGTGGTETGVGAAPSAAVCVSMVIDQYPEANGATYSNTGGTGCYAELGMTGNNDNSGWRTCLFIPGFCDWEVGDGVGGTEAYVGTAADVQECTALVQAETPEANGATYSNTGGNNCYAEFGMNAPNSNTGWQTCLFPEVLNLCEFTVGDGVGGSEASVGEATSMQECAQLVLATSADANGATFSNTGGTGCYAEFGMTESNGNGNWVTCIFPVQQDICTYTVGDGTGGLEVGIGNADTAQECAQMVRSTSPTANGATYSNTGGTGCYAEFGMTGQNSNGGWQTCFFQACEFSIGDGTGGSESGVGAADDAQACARLVQQNEPTANGATFSNTGGTGCYAEFGMTGQNDNGGWQTCVFPANVPVQGCYWGVGDGVGGTEAHVGSANTEAECVTLVTENEPTANGATYSNTGGSGCYAEFGMTGVNGNTGWQTCLFVPGFCDYVTGDGIGGSESNVGNAATPAECVALVQFAEPEANGATYSTTGGVACYAEFGMTGPNNSQHWSTCMFPVIVCEYQVGDGVGGTEQYAGAANGNQECAQLVMDNFADANGATFSNTGGTGCYAEFGMTGTNGNANWLTCLFPEEGPPPLENVIGCEWWIGDGTGGSETGVGDQPDAASCAAFVAVTVPEANGATYSSTGGTACYAEIGMTGHNLSGSWQTCLFLPGFCDFVTGDGVGGSETNIGQALTAAECVMMVQDLAPTANGATYSNIGASTSCYAEYGMTGPNSNGSWQTCMFPDADICEFSVGDGNGVTESGVGDASGPMECARVVLNGTPAANGATYSNTGGTGCYAEFGMTHANGNAGWQTCQFITGCDGVLGSGLVEDACGVCDGDGWSCVVAGCSWVVGDGVGGTESSVGAADSAVACSTLVLAEQPTANGATYSNTGGQGCYAEFGMTGANDNAGWQTCLYVPGYCEYVVGDGVGGTETGVGDAATASECVNLVLASEPTANGATYPASGGTSCYAEFGMTGVNDSTGWQSCLFPELTICDFVTGDGVGGTESFVGEANGAQACVQLVLDTSADANGATYSTTGGVACYAEFGMTGANGSTSWQTCMFTAENGLLPDTSVTGCAWVTGDGVGGSETGVGAADNEAICVSMVRAQFPEANGATYSNTGGTGCYAEFGMTDANSSGSWQTCLFVPNFCDFVPGDGIGGTESGVGAAASAAECVALVQAEAPEANGATYSLTGGTGCYAEFGMTGPNGSTSWQTCLFPEVLNVCEFVAGDGTGGTEESVGAANSMQECAQLVLDTSADANGATFSATGGTGCYAEFGMTGSNGSASWVTCFFTEDSGNDAASRVNGCSWVTGDGIGGTEVGVGAANSAAECVTLVSTTQLEANGATYSNTGGTGCYAEFGMTGQNDNAGWQTCLFVPNYCEYVPGDGVGGTEAGVGQAATAAECVALVQAEAPEANGATYSLTGGTACYAEFGMTGPNSSTAWQVCMFPAIPCMFGVGDGTGGTETLVGDAASPGECAAMVQAAEPTANGATYSTTGGTACYAEIGMTGLNGSTGWQTCMFHELELCTFTQGDGTGNPRHFAPRPFLAVFPPFFCSFRLPGTRETGRKMG